MFLLSESVVYLHVTFVVLHAFLKVFHLCTPCLIQCLMRKDTTRSSQICMGLKPLNLFAPHSRSLTKRKTLPFASSLRHVKNVDMMLECEHCVLWRLLYSQKKLSWKEREELEETLADFMFTCGAPFQELNLPGKHSRSICERHFL